MWKNILVLVMVWCGIIYCFSSLIINRLRVRKAKKLIQCDEVFANTDFWKPYKNVYEASCFFKEDKVIKKYRKVKINYLKNEIVGEEE